MIDLVNFNEKNSGYVIDLLAILKKNVDRTIFHCIL